MRNLKQFIAKMEKEGLSSLVLDTFSYYYGKIVLGESGLIYDKDLESAVIGDIPEYSDIEKYHDAGRASLSKAVIIKLNGGLGTSMGLSKAKSLLNVRDNKTFLDIIIEQTMAVGGKLALMNSFNTCVDTTNALSMRNHGEQPVMFPQHKFPKILKEGLTPAQWPENRELEWNPPGHGDIYTALHTSGALKKLLNQGIEYAFISNSDNLGAMMDEALLGYLVEENLPFLMEVAKRTPSDLKGGHLARLKNGGLALRESAQCPPKEIDSFQDASIYSFFNTNNIWINLKYLERLIKDEKTVKLPIILNPKNLDPRDINSPDVFQVETAMGAAISLFEGARAVLVPRTRFVPVKKCSDLLAVRSDRFMFTPEKKLVLNPENTSDKIVIVLDDKYYTKIDDFNSRIGTNPPSLTACKSLTVHGDVKFEPEVKIINDVVITNTMDKQAVIKSGSIISQNINLS